MDDLQNEIDRDRTRFDAVASLSIAAAGVLGDVIENSQTRSSSCQLLQSPARLKAPGQKEHSKTEHGPRKQSFEKGTGLTTTPTTKFPSNNLRTAAYRIRMP